MAHKSSFRMKQQDLLELYQLLSLYQQTYCEYEERSLSSWLNHISRHFQEKPGAGDIKEATNPRNAGRRKLYSEVQNQAIWTLHGNGVSFRCIARRIGCSIGHVQDVIKMRKKQMDV